MDRLLFNLAYNVFTKNGVGSHTHLLISTISKPIINPIFFARFSGLIKIPIAVAPIERNMLAEIKTLLVREDKPFVDKPTYIIGITKTKIAMTMSTA